MSKFYSVIAAWQDGDAMVEIRVPAIEPEDYEIGDEVKETDLYEYLVGADGRALETGEELDEVINGHPGLEDGKGQPNGDIEKVGLVLPEIMEIIEKTADRILFRLTEDEQLYIAELGEGGKIYYYGESSFENEENAKKNL